MLDFYLPEGKNMRRSRVRITPLGYIVLSIIILVMLVGIYFIIWSMRNGDGKQPEVNAADITTPTPSLAPLDSLITPTPSLAPVNPQTPAPVLSPETPKPADPTPDATPTVDSNNKAVRTPTPSEENNVQDGTLSNSGVVLRAGPSANHAILGKYSSGTRLKIYGADGDYNYVQIVKEKVYGYMATKFIALATPAPSAPSGTVLGKVTASKVAMRDLPSTGDESKRIGELVEGDQVIIYFQTGEFFYIDFNGKKCYAFAEYIKPEGSIPVGTPVP